MPERPPFAVENWEKIAETRRAQIVTPEELKLSEQILRTIGENSTQSVIDIPSKCGLLSEGDLEITETTTTPLLKNLREGKWSSYEVTLAFYKRAIISHQLINCLTDIFVEEALDAAKAVDEYLAQHRKPIGPLHGLPVSLKDCFNLQGHDTTFGYVSWSGNVAETDGLIVQLMKQTGAIPFCKTNVAQGLLLVESSNNLFGTVLNPHNLSLTASGSSGGEAALVAMKGSPLGLCTDAGGSVRLPADANGVYGFMCTTRRITNEGAGLDLPKPLSWVEPQFGPVTNDVESLETWVKALIDTNMSTYDFRCCPPNWDSSELPDRLSIGFLYDDNVTDLTPPIKRTLDFAFNKLQESHDVKVINIGDLHRKITETIFYLYASDGGAMYTKSLKASGEPAIPRTSGSQSQGAMTVHEIRALESKAAAYCDEYLKIFQDNNLDILITASSPNPAAPHGQYSTNSLSAVYNLLGYPAGIIPVTKVDLIKDVPTSEYSEKKIIPDLDVFPVFPYDKYDSYIKKELYTDVEKFKNAPTSIQVVASKYKDEKLLKAMKVIDSVLKSS